jgi:hypothetical protein
VDVPPLDGARIVKSGPSLVYLQIASRERSPASILEDWLSAARERGMRVIAVHPESASASLAGMAGEHVYLRVYGGGGWPSTAIFGRALRAPSSLTSPCVPVPKVSFAILEEQTGIDWQGHRFSGLARWAFETSHDYDVDADGELDAFVPERPSPKGRGCPGDVSRAVYVMRGACGHRVGVVGPGLPRSDAVDAAPDASGFRILTFYEATPTVAKVHVVEFDTREIRFAFERGAYRRLDPRSERVEHGSCEHCATGTCRLAP